MLRDVTPFAEPQDFVYSFSLRFKITQHGGPVVWDLLLFGAHDKSQVVVLRLSPTKQMDREDVSTHEMYFTQPSIPLKCQNLHFSGAGRRLLACGQLDVYGEDRFGEWLARSKEMMAEGRAVAVPDVEPDKYMVVRQQSYVIESEPEDDQE